MFLLALGLSYVAATSASRYLEYKGRALEEQSRNARLNLIPVVAVSADIDVGTRITAEQLKLIELPAAAAPDSAFGTIEEVVGRVNRIRLVADDLVLESKLSPVGAASGLQAVIPEGKRAITVRANDVIGLAGFLRPGDMVDVIGTVQERPGAELIAKTVLQRIPVLTVGKEMERTADGKQKTVETVTLLVSPEEAERLVLVTTEGRIQLVLRSPLDGGENAGRFTTFDQLLDRPKPAPKPKPQVKPAPPPVQEAAPPPPPPPPVAAAPEPDPKITVEIIRGVKKEEREFEQQGPAEPAPTP
jgi:pilus assembly protein CpaB